MAVLYTNRAENLAHHASQGLTAVEISENGPKCLIALRKLFFLYIYPVFKLLIYKGKARGAILRPYPICWHRFIKVALRTRLRASERQVRFVKVFFFLLRGVIHSPCICSQKRHVARSDRSRYPTDIPVEVTSHEQANP